MKSSHLGRASAAVLSALSLLALAVPVAQAAPGAQVDSWNALPAAVTSAQQVWAPRKTLGMRLHSTTRISAEACGSKYTITALYGNGTAVKPAPSFEISQTSGDCDLAPHTWNSSVGTVTTKAGRFDISAKCGWDAKANTPVENWDGGCNKKDVKTFGGLIQLMKPFTPDGTQMQVETTGLTYGQLVAIAKGLRPIN